MRYFDRETAYYIIREKVKANNVVCLKDNKNKVLGIALSEDGLRGIANKTGRYLYTNATKLQDAYKMRKLPWLKVEKYIPSDRPSKEESLWLDRAYRLCSMN